MSETKQPLSVSREESGQKLLRYLERKVDASAQNLHKWLRTGQIRRNGKRAKPFERVDEDDLIRIPPQAELRSPTARISPPRPLPLIFEDENLLVLNKPAGLPSQGGSGHSVSLASLLAGAFSEAAYIPAPAHRLDKDTSGLVLAAKNHATARYLADLFADKSGGQIRKDYLAWVRGRLEPGRLMEFRDLIGKDQDTGKMVIWPRQEIAAPAHYRPAASQALCLRRSESESENASLLRLTLLSGRTHQLRVQLASRGYPILGDPKYGRPEDRGHGLKLHAWRIILPDGRTFLSLPDWPEPWRIRIDPEELARPE